MKMLTKFWLLFLLSLTGCCSLCPEDAPEFFLGPDPAAPAFNNTAEVRDLQEDVINAKMLALRYKVQRIHDRILVGEISEEEGQAQIAEIDQALATLEEKLQNLFMD